jgi:ferric-dicitrate binding protein FerR (iron transport regulator)
MKTVKIERWLLLEQSGELPDRKRQRLRRELESSAEVRRLRDELDRLYGAMPQTDEKPGPLTLQRIHARLGRESRPLLFFRQWKPALALAAGLAVIAGLLIFHEKPGTASAVVFATAEADPGEVWDDPLAGDLEELETLILAISESPLDIMEL